MLTHEWLTDIAQALRDQTVLSVYVDLGERDPTARRRWRVELRHALDDIAKWLAGSSHAEREAFATCRALAEQVLEARIAPGSPGWVGFFTVDGEYVSTPLPAAAKTMAVWSSGPCLTPCIRALKEERPVAVVLVDHHTATVYRYVNATIRKASSFQAKPRKDPRLHMGRPARPGFHAGARGATGADQAQRAAQDAALRVLRQAMDVATRLVAADGVVVVGGIPAVAASAAHLAPRTLAHRLAIAESLDVHATPAQLADAARAYARQVRERNDERRVEELLASVERDGRAATGSVDTLSALHEGRARELLLTQRFLEDHVAEAESFVRLAIDLHVPVAHVGGAAAAALDAVGGLGVRLRYPALVSTPA